MLIDAALGLTNHILGQETWARHRLQPFSGQIIRLDVGPLSAAVSITAEGYFKAARQASPPTVSLSVTTDSFLRSLVTRKPLEGDVQISGSVRLAECLLNVLKGLHWDIEADLSPLLGDIVAHRLVLGSRRLSKYPGNQVDSVAREVADYLTSERAILARRARFSTLIAEADTVEHALETLAARVAHLEQQAHRP